jgi:hypothetical protein
VLPRRPKRKGANIWQRYATEEIRREANMWVQVVPVVAVAVVFLVRLSFALHKRPSKPQASRVSAD